MQIICGKCGQHIELDESGHAASVRCPSCSHEIPLGDSRTNGIDEDAGFASRARRLLSETIQIECDSCSQCLKVAKKMAGRKIRCPGCGYMISVPAEILDPEAFEKPKPVSPLEADLAAIAQAASSSSTAHAAEALAHHKPFKKPGMGVMPWLLLLVAAGMVGGIVYGLQMMKSKPNAISIAEEQANSQAPAIAASETSKASLRLVACSWQIFANQAGYFPATPGRLYACVELQAATDKDELEISFDDAGPFIEAGGNRFPALGTEINAASAIPADASRKLLTIPPQTTQNFRLIFNLPAIEFRGRLEIKGCNDLLVSLPAPPQYSTDLAGDYVERAPRNLKPMQHDPMIREFQLHYGQTFTATPVKNNAYTVKFPQSQVSGTAELQADRTFLLKLNHASKGTLTCRAALAGDGKVLIVFFSDNPMQQLIFQKQPRG